MKLFTTILLTLMMLTVATAGENSAVPKQLLKEAYQKLEILDRLERATPTFSINGVEVVQDTDGRVFVKDTAEVTVLFDSEGLAYVGEVKIDAKVAQFKNKRRTPFISRFGLASVAEQREFQSTQLDKNSMYLTYRVIGYHKISLEALANFRRFGVGVARKLTPNTKIIVGVNYRYTETLKSNTKAFVGVGFSF